MTDAGGERLMVLFKESSKNFGGQERRLLREAFWLLEAGHGVRIATPPEGILYERARSAGVPADAVPMRGSAECLITAGRERAKDFDAAGGMERLVRHFREVART